MQPVGCVINRSQSIATKVVFNLVIEKFTLTEHQVRENFVIFSISHCWLRDSMALGGEIWRMKKQIVCFFLLPSRDQAFLSLIRTPSSKEAIERGGVSWRTLSKSKHKAIF